MGATGAGKSSFIAAATGRSVKIGHTLESCNLGIPTNGKRIVLTSAGTLKTTRWKYIAHDKSEIYLVDTPGFNDAHRPDAEILKDILNYILSRKLRIISVIYLHRITERRITGSTKQNLRMLRAMCGEHYIQNIVVATTMWGTIPSTSMEGALAREAELYTSKSFWGDMIKRGARYIRWDASSEDAQDIVEKCLTKSEAPPLAILLELTNGITQEETSAGQILTEQIRQRRESERAELEEEQEVNKALLIRKTDLEEQVNNAIMENQRQYEIARTAPPPTSYHERRQWEQGFGPVNVVDGYLQPVNFYPAQDERMRAQQVQVQSQNQGRHVLRRRRASGSDTGKKPWYEMTLRKWH